MTANKPLCKICKSIWHYQTFCPRKRQKQPKKLGSRQLVYIEWRDNIAKPYLDANFGHKCAKCGSPYDLDVDHIIKRSLAPSKVKDLSNVQYLCRACHSAKDV